MGLKVEQCLGSWFWALRRRAFLLTPCSVSSKGIRLLIQSVFRLCIPLHIVCSVGFQSCKNLIPLY